MSDVNFKNLKSQILNFQITSKYQSQILTNKNFSKTMPDINLHLY